MFTGRVTGFWWLPETPDHRVGGALHLEWDERPRLELFGHLQSMDLKRALGHMSTDTLFPLVHGQATDGRAVTLWEARVGSSRMHLEDPQDAYLEVTANKALLGVRVAAGDAAFRRLRIRVEHLLDWLDAPLLEQSYENLDGRWIAFRHGWRKLPPREWRVGTARVQIGANARAFGDRMYETSIGQWAEVVVDPMEPASADDLYARYIGPLANLLTFVTGRAAAVEYVGLVPAGADDASEAELIWKRRAPRDLSPRPVMPHDLLFAASAIPRALTNPLERWFELSEDLEDVMNLFLGTRYAPTMFEQNRFLNLVQAAEAIHRARAGDARATSDDDRTRTEAVLNAVPEEHRAWLASVMEGDARIHFADRLRNLLAWDPWLVPEVIPNSARFVRSATDARNLHTHWDRTSTPHAPRDFDLWALNEMLIVILEARILDRLGFDSGERHGLIAAGSAAYRALKLNPDAVEKVRRRRRGTPK